MKQFFLSDLIDINKSVAHIITKKAVAHIITKNIKFLL